MASFTPEQLYPQCQFDRTLGGLSERFGRGKRFLTSAGNHTTIPLCETRRIISIRTALCRQILKPNNVQKQTVQEGHNLICVDYSSTT
jgi:hypothetical protein